MTDTVKPLEPVYKRLAELVAARDNCVKSGNTEWHAKHCARIMAIVKRHIPSGSGFDNGTHFGAESTPEKLIFFTSFHHMNEHGYSDGWTKHTVTVRPSLTSEFTLTISGRNRNEIKELIHEAFYFALRESCRENE